MIILEIPRVPCSPNDLLGYHWRYRASNAKLWKKEIWLALHDCGVLQPHEPFAHASVKIHRRSRGELDPDNLVGCVKPLLDALCFCHVLVDDSPQHLVLEVTQTRDHTAPPRTLIEIQPLEALPE